VIDHLVHLQLVVARAGLEEEVVREVLDEVARREDIVSRPRTPERVLRQRALAAGDEVLRVADAEDAGEGLVVASSLRTRPFCSGEAPVSIVLIAVATSSTWPNSSAAMLATRS
jgi:hypothetical protein